MNKKFVALGIILFILLIGNISIASSNSDTKNNNTSGFFQVEQSKGRWRFVDPDGEPFFSTGVCNVNAHGFFAPSLGYSPYYQNIIDLYGDEETWANVTHDRLETWGFNTIASGDEYIINTGLPYTLNLGLASCNRITRDIPDYLSKEWIEQVDQICKEKVAPRSNDTKLIGYFLANELRWGPEFQDLGDVFAEYCSMPWNSSGKIFLVDFLHDRHNGDITVFNRAWWTRFRSFDELYNVTSLGIFPRTIKARKDRTNFTYLVAEQFFKVCHDAVRRYDENHLILGTRFLSYGTPREVLRACSHYVDVISVNHYPIRFSLILTTTILEKLFNFVNAKNMLQEYYDISNKPILISEIHFRAWDAGLPNTKPSPLLMPVCLTQNMRANRFYRMLSRFLEKPYSVGYHWFTYMDEPKTGRSRDGENSNIGIVNEMDESYLPVVNRMTEINQIARDSVRC